MRIRLLRAVMPILMLGGNLTPLAGDPGTARHDTLTREQTNRFADSVLDACGVVCKTHYPAIKSGPLIDAAIRGLFAELKEPLPAAIRERLARVGALNDEEQKTLLADARRHLGARKELAAPRDVDRAVKHLVTALDPFAEFRDRETLDARVWNCFPDLNVGVGLELRRNAVHNRPEVVTPAWGSPAHNAGVQTGDLLLTIVAHTDPKLLQPQAVETKGLPVEQAARLLLGPNGSRVKIFVRREGEKHPLAFDLVRTFVARESVHGYRRTADGSWDHRVDTKNGISYIRISQFRNDTDDDLRDALTRLRKNGMRGLVLDLRACPGASFEMAESIADLLVNDEILFTFQMPGGQRVLRGQRQGSFTDFPVAVLIDRTTASGAEIVAACLQDHRRAVVMGERSFGEGGLQVIQSFEDGELTLTRAVFLRPSGKSLNRPPRCEPSDDWGVRPDRGFLLELTAKEHDELTTWRERTRILPRPGPPALDPAAGLKDRHLEKALEHLRQQIQPRMK